MIRFGWDFTPSKPVRRAFVARIASCTSPLEEAVCREEARDSISSIRTMLKELGEEVQWDWMAVKTARMHLADSEKNLDSSVAALIWMRLVEE